MLGGQIGYSLQSGSLVYGLEADISFGKLNDFIRDGNYLTESGKISQLGTVRARLGYDMGGWMPYITGGLMWDTLQQNTTCPAGAGFGVCAATGPFSATVTKTFTGWTAGPGAELAISDKWSLKGDVLFSNLGKQTYTSTIPVAGTISAQLGQTLHSVSRLGISYKF